VLVMTAARRLWSLLWAARLIARWEGWLGTAYLDEIASPPVWTIGYGHSNYAAPPTVHAGERWSRAKGLRVLAHDCRSSAAAVGRYVTHKLTARQRMALISFVFNLGPNILPGTELLRCLNEGKWERAGQLMLTYDHSGGEVVQGLLRRRMAEAWLLTHPRKRQIVKPRKKDRVHTRAEQRPAA
jgi:lysozyme